MSTSREEIEKLKSSDKVSSIYYVCGLDPWLIILNSDIGDVFNFGPSYQLNIKYMSISPPIYCKRKNSNLENKIIFWIFIKGQTESSFDKILKELNSEIKFRTNYEIAEIYELFGEFHLLIKLYTSNVNGVDDFLTLCRRKGMSTSTKCVLYTVKENRKNIDAKIETKRRIVDNVKKEINYAVARIIFNTKDFIHKNPDDQRKFLDLELGKMGVTFSTNSLDNYILNPDITMDEYSLNDLEHPNKLINRYSVKLERRDWLKILLFFKAEVGQKDKLENVIQEELLGVHSSHFARKLYHITGDYDFMVPFDCMDIKVLNETIDNFLGTWGELITSFTNTVCRPIEGKEAHPLNALDIPFIESLLINSTQMSQFEHKVRDREIFSSILSGSDLKLAEMNITPREDYVRYKIKNKDRTSIKEYLKGFKSFENIGIESTIELKNGALIQTLSKFFFKDVGAKEKFLREINEKIKKFEIIAIIYEPVRDPLTVMCILMVKDLVELEVLFDDFLRRYCKKIEYHIIFHQRYFSKVIEQNIRCKPCFYPLIPKEDCKKECVECEEQKGCIKQNCGKCIRYILPRKVNRILNIDSDCEIKQYIKISVVGIDLSLSQYFALEKLLDQEEKRKIIFENYKIISNKLNGKAKNVYKNYEKVLTEYNRITDKDLYREQYKNACNRVLNYILALDPDIIVFPEYAIPSYVYDTIRKSKINKECIIVAGSHVNNDLFNVCPIIFNEVSGGKKIYNYYKNNFSPFEEELNLVKNMGTAYLKFLNSSKGNVYIQLCFDAYSVEVEKMYKNIDILLVPSYNTSSEFIKPIKQNAMNYKLVAAYANTINEVDLESNFFIPPDDGKKASMIEIQQIHPDQWPDIKITEDRIFEISPQNSQFEELKENEFNFKLKHIDFDLAQLDKRRGISSRRNLK